MSGLMHNYGVPLFFTKLYTATSLSCVLAIAKIPHSAATSKQQLFYGFTLDSSVRFLSLTTVKAITETRRELQGPHPKRTLKLEPGEVEAVPSILSEIWNSFAHRRQCPGTRESAVGEDVNCLT